MKIFDSISNQNETTRMKQLLTLIALLIVGSSVATAQEPEEVDYIFFTWILDNDSAVLSVGFPTLFPDTTPETSFDNTQWRGMGQVFNPGLIYDWYDEIYGPNTNIHFDGTNETTDQDYIEQFRGAGAYTVDSVNLFIFSRDPNAFNNSETLGSLVSVIKSDYDFQGPTYLTQGYREDFSVMRGDQDENVLAENYFTADELAATYNAAAGNVQGTRIRYESGALSFEPGESAIFMYHTPADPGYTFDEIQERQTNGQSNQQNVIITQGEYRNGGLISGGDTRRDSLTYYKSLGLVLFRDGNGTDRLGDENSDTVYSAWRGLQFNQRPALLDYRMIVWGTVEVDTGTNSVRYHFGRAADNQGLGNVQPNPAVADARLPFSLTERADVTIEVFGVNGEKVATLVDRKRYIEGNYDVMIPVSEMQNGSYVIRMSANEKAYSMKFTVAK